MRLCEVLCAHCFDNPHTNFSGCIFQVRILKILDFSERGGLHVNQTLRPDSTVAYFLMVQYKLRKLIKNTFSFFLLYLDSDIISASHDTHFSRHKIIPSSAILATSTPNWITTKPWPTSAPTAGPNTTAGN